MVFSYNWLQSFFYPVKSSKAGAKQFNRVKKKLPKPEKLAELLTIHSFEVGEVKKVGSDWVLDIEVLPNRASDCFSHIGIAREIAAITNSNYREQFPIIKEDKTIKAKDFVKIEIKNRAACPRYTARVVTDVKVAPSPKWIQERLKICGLRPINNVVDIANYVMLETGQPLHAFDAEKLEGQKIIVRFAKNREKIVTLDGEKPSTRAELGAGLVPHRPAPFRRGGAGAGYDLDENILVIADAEKPVAIAGIKGGKIPEIAKSTKIVVLESANFNPRIVRRGSKKLGLITDASWRFEHGISPDLTEMAINRAAFLIQKIAKGKIAKGLIDFYPKKVLPKIVKLDLDYLKNLLGTEIPKNEVLKILKKLEFKILNSKLNILTIEVPTWRLDVSIPEDLIEEIGRIAGFEKIKAVFPTAALIPPKRNLDVFWEEMTKNILKEAGFTEVYNYSFFGDKEAKLFGYREKELGEVENPISIEQKYLRTSLIPNLLKNVEKNAKYFPEIKIFELGKTFKNLKITEEKRMLTGLILPGDFRQLKGVVDLILNKLGISNIWYDDYQPTPEESKIAIWHPKKCAEIKVDREEIGFLGEISPRILENLKFLGKVVVFDVDFEKLSKLASEETIYQPISRFPAAVRDLAVLVPRGTKVVEVLNKINIIGGSLVKDVDLFDIYEGEELPRGKKNLAFHLIYQVEGRTLKSEEIDEIHQKIIKALEKDPEWQVRK